MNYLDLAERGEHPLLLARMKSGYAVLADTQFLPGYCILLASPGVDHLTDLAMPQRLAFLEDMSVIGEALLATLKDAGVRRVNYEILGNTDAYLHAHIIPRYQWEPPENIGKPAFNYPADRWSDPQWQFDASRHGAMREQLTAFLAEYEVRE